MESMVNEIERDIQAGYRLSWLELFVLGNLKSVAHDPWYQSDFSDFSPDFQPSTIS